ncbi:MAG: hypothetical protein U1F04_10445 [Burkholderiaceae bacterium]
MRSLQTRVPEAGPVNRAILSKPSRHFQRQQPAAVLEIGMW